ncbi:MAG: hypothetical protein BGO82_01860 [Devosia sp. 67-54]|uniref:SGNH/GDSL hydrolase family protein n=1 Tax=unclassified Devosia TaxID=196773 RepID=UPI00095DFD0A|nr:MULTISPECIES: SGNH family hydrolase [unclassified Devosia]MBN9305786.1 DUF459 domain-containing protein [Devosia sp.]OJX16506.1 MAG: hypothetical protein BGO82_01860 [Devosia sp. 67-54]
MLRRLVVLILVALFVAGDVAPVAAQGLFGGGGDQSQSQQPQKKRRTLFDMLFGGGQQEETPPPAPVVVKPKKATLPAPAKPAAEKAANATRLAVFGDSMAVDLAKALDRLYQDDPNIVVINQGVGSSGFARPDFFDWDKTAVDQVSKNSFDIAVMIVGINDRQTIKLPDGSVKPLTPEWTDAYKQRVADFVAAIKGANKPLIWVGLPPMAKADFSTAMGQISSIQRLAVFAGGSDFLDIYDKFVDDDGNYTSTGPDINGTIVQMRKGDGIHFSAAGADKLAFYVSQSLKLYYHGSGGVGIDIADVLAGTDAAVMVRPPYQGLGQTRLLEIAGAVVPLSQTPKRAAELVTASAVRTDTPFDLSQMLDAPKGRVDAFGVGKDPAQPEPAAAAAN